jgi:4-oxalomesaconate hydratase
MLTPQARVLVVGAHAADFCFRAGGAIARYGRNGVTKVVCATFGERSESGSLWETRPGITEAEVKRIRRQEAERAAKILGADIVFLDWGDFPLIIDRKRLMALAKIVQDFRPEIVLTHWVEEPENYGHALLSKAVLRACHVQPQSSTHIVFFEPNIGGGPLARFRPDIYLDITAVFEQKMRALREFRTQPYLAERWAINAEYRGVQARKLCGLDDCQYAEAYQRFQPWGGLYF